MLERQDFENLEEQDLENLIQGQVPEGISLEYKRELYGGSDSEKKEMLKDISALANTRGGHLILGMDEIDGTASSLISIGNGVDDEINRIDQIVRSSIDPIISGFRARGIPLSSGGNVIVCRVPKSWIGPHRVLFKGDNRFYLRSTASVYQPSVEELRMLFSQSISNLDQAKSFRDQRINEIDQGQEIRPLVGGGRLYVHICPISAFGGMNNIDLEQAISLSSFFEPLGASGRTPRFNYHGFICERGGQENHGYVQIFRNGLLEATKGGIIRENDRGRFIPGTALEGYIFEAIPRYILGLNQLGITGPYIILITLDGVHQIRYAVRHNQYEDTDDLLPYPTLKLPEGYLSEAPSLIAVHRAMRPCFDALWNAVGFSSSQYFDHDGLWIGNTHAR